MFAQAASALCETYFLNSASCALPAWRRPSPMAWTGRGRERRARNDFSAALLPWCWGTGRVRQSLATTARCLACVTGFSRCRNAGPCRTRESRSQRKDLSTADQVSRVAFASGMRRGLSEA